MAEKVVRSANPADAAHGAGANAMRDSWQRKHNHTIACMLMAWKPHRQKKHIESLKDRLCERHPENVALYLAQEEKGIEIYRKMEKAFLEKCPKAEDDYAAYKAGLRNVTRLTGEKKVGTVVTGINLD